MKNPTIEDLMMLVNTYTNEEDVKMIMRAYKDAESLHSGARRQSGEPYISHPLYVAYLEASRFADRDTICACLLHDTIEDTYITKEDIAREYNEDIAILTDGVSKISRLNYSTKQEQNMANIRKLVTGIKTDVRIHQIKLADRTHNMRTLGFKKREKQVENAQETMDIMVHIANYLGDNETQVELRDLSLMYLEPDIYKYAKETRDKIEEESKKCLEEMSQIIKNALKKEGINSEITPRIKSIYGISKYLEANCNLVKMNDLLALKIVVEDFSKCYQSLGVIHREFRPVPNRMKDYICNPKTNLYQSLHTTVFGLEGRHIQAQIRTERMHKIAAKGLAAYWEFYGQNAKHYMQEELEKKSQFYSYLIDANESIESNQAFVDCLKAELFANHIHVYDQTGEVIELPIDASPIDFAYRIDSDKAPYLTSATVNGEDVSLDYKLKNQDRVKVVTNTDVVGLKTGWENIVKTSYAKQKIKEFKAPMKK